MKIVFLGTASCFPTPRRGVSCTALQLDDGSVWIFDCGEGSQVQLQKSCIKPGKITKIFITHLHGDHLFGLPGLLCTLGNGIDPEKKEVTIDLYGPEGLRKYVWTSLGLSRSPLVFRLAVHELIPREDQFPPDWASWEVSHQMTEPPLAQESFYERLEYSEAVRGWSLYQDQMVRVEAAALRHRIPSFGFVISERSSPGRLDTARLAELGILPGPIFGKLKSGQAVTLDTGQTLQPDLFLGPSSPGRKLAILGDTCDSSELQLIAKDLDLLVHEATMEDRLKEKCVEFGHSTPSMAAGVAIETRAKNLILFHVSPRYKPLSLCDESNQDSAQILLDEALKHLQDNDRTDVNVIVAEDFTEFVLQKNK